MDAQKELDEKPRYADWLRELQMKAVSAQRDEEEERRWRERVGKA